MLHLQYYNFIITITIAFTRLEGPRLVMSYNFNAIIYYNLKITVLQLQCYNYNVMITVLQLQC